MKTGLIAGKRKLNQLHAELAKNGYEQVSVMLDHFMSGKHLPLFLTSLVSVELNSRQPTRSEGESHRLESCNRQRQ